MTRRILIVIVLAIASCDWCEAVPEAEVCGCDANFDGIEDPPCYCNQTVCD